jgi:hypothetical protein
MRKAWSGTFLASASHAPTVLKKSSLAREGHLNIPNDPQFQGFRGLARLLLASSLPIAVLDASFTMRSL